MTFKPSAILLTLVVLFAAASAHAQFFMDFPDWKESEVPPPPAYDVSKVLTFEVVANPGMTYGVDPSTIVISKADSLVRYVVVATSKSGVSNVMYEALHCATGEVKTYARRVGTSPWLEVKNAQWRSVFASAPSRHSLAFAKAGACDAQASAASVREIVGKLKDNRPFLDQ
jgi:hypothetical protein